ncbi:MAG: Lrp/AsnC family transcriptional regulator [Candidatus Micrarchaeia archaeon]
MGKKSAIKLDGKDRKILLELETNARQSASRIARKARLSEEVVSYRIKKYIKQEIITKFFVIPIFDKLGFTTYRIYLRFGGTTPEMEREVVEYIKNEMPCQWIGICDGGWDVIARISARGLFEFNNLMSDFFLKFGGRIKDKEVTLQLRHTWWPSTYGLTSSPPRKTPQHEIPASVQPIGHDETDLKILSLLARDARMPSVAMAQLTGVSPDTVNFRIKKLLKEGAIMQFKCFFNRELLGYQHNQVFARLSSDPKRVRELVAYLNESPEVFFISSMVGAWDMQFGIDAKNSVEFHKAFGKIKESFADVIVDYESLIVYEEYSPDPFRHFIEKK